jgi:hypothetical protein
VKLGRFHQSLELIPKPGFDPMSEEQLLDDGNILSGGLVIEADLTA